MIFAEFSGMQRYYDCSRRHSIIFREFDTYEMASLILSEKYKKKIKMAFAVD